MLLYGSLILGVINLAALYLISHHRPKAGWWVYLLVQIPMSLFDIVTHQYGFVLLSLSTIGVSLKSLHIVKKGLHS